MIEEVRSANLENSGDMNGHLESAEDGLIFREFSSDFYHRLMDTRRSLQALFDFLSTLQINHKTEGRMQRLSSHHKKRAEQVREMMSFFIAIQRATSSIVKGGFHLAQRGIDSRPTAGTILQTADKVMDEGKKLAVFCQTSGISPFEDGFLQRVLTTVGYEGFRKLVENTEFVLLKERPEFFKEAVMRQQGDPEVFLRSKIAFVNRSAAELEASREFDELREKDSEIFARAVMQYPFARTARGKKFSNARDYLRSIRENMVGQKKGAGMKKRQERKKG